MKTVKLMKTIPMATGILGMLAAVFLATPANAASLGNTQVSCHGSGGPIDLGPANQSLSCDNSTNPAYGYISAAANLGSLSAYAKGTGYGDISPGGTPYISSASARVNYYFDLTAPTGYDPNLLVPVVTDVYLLTSVTGGGHNNHDIANAAVVINQSAPHAAAALACVYSGYNCGGPDFFSGSFVDNLAPNSQNTVAVFANITLNSDAGAAPDTAYAYADPYIRIDPAFLTAHPGYTLTFSTNVTNAPPVPVPAAGWLFGSGLMGLAGVARRKKAA